MLKKLFGELKFEGFLRFSLGQCYNVNTVKWVVILRYKDMSTHTLVNTASHTHKTQHHTLHKTKQNVSQHTSCVCNVLYVCKYAYIYIHL